MKPVTVFTLCDFFSDYPERIKKGQNSFVSVTVHTGGVFIGTVQALMKKHVYTVEVRNTIWLMHRFTYAASLVNFIPSLFVNFLGQDEEFAHYLSCLSLAKV